MSKKIVQLIRSDTCSGVMVGFVIWSDYNYFPPQLFGIPHGHGCAAPLLAVVNSQQAGGVIDQIAVALQHAAGLVLPVYVEHLIRLN